MLYRYDAADLDRYLKDDPSHYLHWAVLHNDVPRIRELPDSRYDINKIDQRDGAPLHIAIWCDCAAAFQLLFIRGADLDILDFGDEGRPRDTSIRLAARLGRRYLFKRP
jgi:ankyrin repeat protein